MLSGAGLNPDNAIPRYQSVCAGRAKVHRGGSDFRPPTEAALLVVDPGQRLFQFRDQRLDALHSHMVRDLTRQRLDLAILFSSSARPESWYAPVLSMVVSIAMRSIIFYLRLQLPLFLTFHAKLKQRTQHSRS